jgi:hypothetical protein
MVLNLFYFLVTSSVAKFLSFFVLNRSWTSDNATLFIARKLFASFAQSLTAAFEQPASGGGSLSLWDTQAALFLASFPPGLINGLSLSAKPRSVLMDPASIAVEVCRWNEPCYAPTAAPTVPRPSNIPTPSPTSVEPYTLRPVRITATCDIYPD